jgi:thiamine-monophosphate kinase
MSVTIALLGRVERERLLRRSGAKPGDLIMVTGGLGSAATGWVALDQGLSGPSFASALTAQRRPRARLREARALAGSGVVSAMIDVSDGLAGDLAHICEESQVGARVDLTSVPVAEACRTACDHLAGADCLQLALTGGEDFELLFTASPGAVGGVHRALASAGGRAFPVGSITQADAGIVGVTKEGRAQPLGEAYRHF